MLWLFMVLSCSVVTAAAAAAAAAFACEPASVAITIRRRWMMALFWLWSVCLFGQKHLSLMTSFPGAIVRVHGIDVLGVLVKELPETTVLLKLIHVKTNNRKWNLHWNNLFMTCLNYDALLLVRFLHSFSFCLVWFRTQRELPIEYWDSLS